MELEISPIFFSTASFIRIASGAEAGMSDEHRGDEIGPVGSMILVAIIIIMTVCLVLFGRQIY